MLRWAAAPAIGLAAMQWTAAAQAVNPQTTTLGVTGDGKADFLYDPATGDVRFMLDGYHPIQPLTGAPSFVATFEIRSASGLLLPLNAAPAILNSGLNTLRSNFIGGVLASSPGFYDGYDIGHILAPNLSGALLQADMTLKFVVLNGGAAKTSDLVIAPAPVNPANNYTTATGNWSAVANWSAGRAGQSGDTVTLAPAGAGAVTVTFDTGASATAMTQLVIDATSGGSVTLLQAQGTLGITGSEIVGLKGNGSVNQTGGTHSIGSNLVVGGGSAATGTYSLSAGNLTVTGDSSVGGSGPGIFNHSGGNHTLGGSLYVGNTLGASGTYNLSGTGVLSSGSDEVVGLFGAGVFNQSGCTNVINSNGVAADGTLILGDAVQSSGTYNMTGGD